MTEEKRKGIVQARRQGLCVRTPKPVTRTFIACDVGGDLGSIAGSTATPTSPIVKIRTRCYKTAAFKQI